MSVVVVDEQTVAMDTQLARIDVIEDWARGIDADWWHHPVSSERAFRDAEAAWGGLVPCEDDPAWLMACYARSLFEAVAGAAEDIAGSCVHDPRDFRRNGFWRSVLTVPRELAG